MQLWSLSGLANNAAHNNQSTERIVNCSCHKQPSAKSCGSVALWHCSEAITFGSMTRIVRLQPALKKTTFPQDLLLVTRLISTSTINWTGIMAVFEKLKPLMSSSGTKDIHKKWTCSVTFQKRRFMVHSCSWGTQWRSALTLWLLPQLEKNSNDFVLQQDGAPPHFHVAVPNHLNVHRPWRWIFLAETRSLWLWAV